MNITPLNTVITATGSEDTSAYNYYQVYAGGSVAVSVTINGTVVNMAPGSTIDIFINSISTATDVYVIGSKKVPQQQYL